jgi:hypothetical protein
MSTEQGSDAPSELAFSTWQNYPQKPQKVIQKFRRLGSSNIIRQDLGSESVEQTSTATRTFLTHGNSQDFIDELTKACNRETFYTFEDENNTHYVNRICLLGFTYRETKKYGGAVGDGYDGIGTSLSFILCEYTINYVVDGEAP